MAIPTNLFNTGTVLASVSVNRGPYVAINGAPPPNFMPQQGFPAPPWNPGGPSTGQIGPGSNTMSLQTSGVILPLLTLSVPNVNPGSIQTYLIWFLDPTTNDAQLGAAILNAGQLLVSGIVSGTAQPVTSP